MLEVAMRSNVNRFLLALLSIVAILCTISWLTEPSAAQTQTLSGRFQLVRGALQTTTGPQELTLRIDTETGETWVLLWDRNAPYAKWAKIPG
jgi:hypothetical protein